MPPRRGLLRAGWTLRTERAEVSPAHERFPGRMPPGAGFATAISTNRGSGRMSGRIRPPSWATHDAACGQAFQEPEQEERKGTKSMKECRRHSGFRAPDQRATANE